MTNKLCIFDIQLGSPFVDLHLKGVLPGATVAVSRIGKHPLAAHFAPLCPTLFLDDWGLKLSTRLAIRLGFDRPKLTRGVVRKFLRKHQVNAVLGEYLDQFAEFVPLLDRKGIPYIVQGHGVDVSASMRKRDIVRTYEAYRTARAILTRSEFHRQRLITIGLPPNKVHVNPGGVVIPEAIPPRNSDAAKRLLAVGRFCPQKAPIALLESFRLASLQDPDISLDYIGWGPLRSTAMQYIAAHKLESRVTLHGLVSEEKKTELFSNCGVFVQHSAVDPETGDEEGLPAAIQEAMAMGLAVVSTRHTGIAEAVVEGETGLLVDELDIEGMARAMLEIQVECLRFGVAGRERAKELYSWEAENKRLRRWLFDKE